MNGTMTFGDGTEHPIEITEISINTIAGDYPRYDISGRMRDIPGGTFEANFYDDTPKKVTNWRKQIEGE